MMSVDADSIVCQDRDRMMPKEKTCVMPRKTSRPLGKAVTSGQDRGKGSLPIENISLFSPADHRSRLFPLSFPLVSTFPDTFVLLPLLATEATPDAAAGEGASHIRIV